MSLYNTELSRGALMPLESKRIAKILLETPSEAAWKKAIEVDNVLQKNSVGTAVRQSRLIRKRLSTLDNVAWTLIAERESEISHQLLFAAAIKQNKLLGDFMRNVYTNSQQRMESDIVAANWEDFLTECAHLDSTVADWNDSTKLKIYNSIIGILVETKYLRDHKTMQLTPRSLHPVVQSYLHDRGENYLLDCLERAK